MLLCIDMGNTSVKTMVYDGDKEVKFHKSNEPDFLQWSALFNEYSITACILSSTRIIEKEWVDFLESHFPLLLLDHETPVPITNAYGTAATLGKDRLAAAVAANALFPNQKSIIIDAGTCLTYNFLDEKSRYLGGNIAPGINMRLSAMHHFTDKLPLVKAQYNDSIFGENTEMALQNGAVKGAIYELTSFIEDVMKHYGETNIILTGGDAIIFAKHLKFKIFAHPNLVLLGLKEILKFNADHIKHKH